MPLHAAGMPVSAAESGRLAEVIELRRPLTVAELYWCARISLVRSPDQIGPFAKRFGKWTREVVSASRQPENSVCLVVHQRQSAVAVDRDHPIAHAPDELSKKPVIPSRPATGRSKEKPARITMIPPGA